MMDWSRCNRTELYQLCRGAGLPVRPTDNKERLIAVLDATVPDEPVLNPVDDVREALARFVDDFWARLRSQLTCPAISHQPDCCKGCIDAKVIACSLGGGNAEVQRLIQLRRPKR